MALYYFLTLYFFALHISSSILSITSITELMRECKSVTKLITKLTFFDLHLAINKELIELRYRIYTPSFLC
jgi:hypothetical protein